MRFNIDLPVEEAKYLEKEYKDYLTKRSMTKKERRAVLKWVRDGNSVYDNPMDGWYAGGKRIEFLDIYRDTNDLLLQTKDMSPEEANRVIRGFYGYDTSNDLDPGESNGSQLLDDNPNDDTIPFG